MPRPRAYDPDSVMDKIMDAFWRKGYEGTSLADIEAATGLNRSSLYSAFGDMHTLYLASLKRFRDVTQVQVKHALETSGSVHEAFRRVFSHNIEAALADPDCRGCMIVNATAECVPHHAQVSAFIHEVDRATEAAFAEVLRAAQARGELTSHHDPEKLATYLYSSLQGLRLRSKAAPERGVLEGIMEITLSVL